MVLMQVGQDRPADVGDVVAEACQTLVASSFSPADLEAREPPVEEAGDAAGEVVGVGDGCPCPGRCRKAPALARVQ